MATISFARGAPSLDIVDVEGLKEASRLAFENDPAGTTAYGTSVGNLIWPPLRNSPSVTSAITGGKLTSRRKLYSVPQRSAFAFAFWANVDVDHVTVCVVVSFTTGQSVPEIGSPL